MVNYCTVCRIERTVLNPCITFHTLPKDPGIRKKWCDILQKHGAKQLLVCSKHFKPEDYRLGCVTRLKKDAVPRVELFSTVEEKSFSPESHGSDDQEEFVDTSILEQQTSESIDNCATPLDSETSQNTHDLQLEISPSSGVNKTVEKVDEPETEDIQESERFSNTTSDPVTQPNISNSRKRSIDFHEQIDPASKKRCNIQGFGIFRREDFANDGAWIRFNQALDALRNKQHVLERSCMRLRERINTSEEMLDNLKSKKQLTYSTEEFIHVYQYMYSIPT